MALDQSNLDEKGAKLRHRKSQKVATSCGSAELFLGLVNDQLLMAL
jgi:hypothetical protein